MNKSESIGKLSMALSALQGEVKDAHKDKTGYGYKYADLSGVLEIARPLCKKHGLAISQLCCSGENSEVGIETVLMHVSGEYISSTMMMPLTAGGQKNAAQSAGSVITYARRYALAAILGITQTDDDAASSAHAGTTGTSAQSAPKDLEHKIKKAVKEGKIDKADVVALLEKFDAITLGDLNPAQLRAVANKVGV